MDSVRKYRSAGRERLKSETPQYIEASQGKGRLEGARGSQRLWQIQSYYSTH